MTNVLNPAGHLSRICIFVELENNIGIADKGLGNCMGNNKWSSKVDNSVILHEGKQMLAYVLPPLHDPHTTLQIRPMERGNAKKHAPQTDSFYG